jgi:TP901 family phage tail tape measure protein
MAETKNDVNLRVGALVDFASLSVAEKAVGSFSDKIVNLAKWAGAAIAAGSVAVAIQRTADKFNDLGDVVSRVGNATVKELDRLGYVAELTGSDANTATASFENLSRTIGEAAQGIGRGALVFEKLGLSAKDAQGNVKTTTQVLDEIKVKIKDLSKAEQSAYIQRLGLDRSVIGMLTSDTTEIIDQYNKRTEALGINVDEAAELGAKYNDAIKVTKRGFDDIITAFVLRVLPSITTAIERVSKLIDENAGLIKSYVDPIAAAVSIGANLVTGFITGLGKMFQVLGKWPIYIGLVTAAWKVLNMVFKASPIGRIITAVMTLITVLGLLYDDFKGWQEGMDSLFDWSFLSAEWWKSKADTISNELSLLGERIQGFLSDSWNNAITEASNKWDELKNTISQKAQGVYDGIISTFVGLSTWFGDLWKSIGDGAMSALTDIGKAFTQWWNDLINSVKNFGKEATEKAGNMVTDAWDTSVNAFKGLFSWGSKKDDDKAASSLPTATTNNNQRSRFQYLNNKAEALSPRQS